MWNEGESPSSPPAPSRDLLDFAGQASKPSSPSKETVKRHPDAPVHRRSLPAFLPPPPPPTMPPRAVPASFWRGGTSRGLLFRAETLAAYSPAARDRIILTALGSPDPAGAFSLLFPLAPHLTLLPVTQEGKSAVSAEG